MDWPPKIGVPLPRAAEALGVREKLVGYSLDIAHEQGGPKARGFERILGITIKEIDHLEAEIRTGILTAPVEAVRDRPPYGIHCEVRVAIRGLGDKRERIVGATTGWELAFPGAAPRLTTAYLRP
jgi:uncharacterized protein DUF6883